MPGTIVDDRLVSARAEFDSQVQTLIRLGYPDLTGISADEFAHRLSPLIGRLPAQPQSGPEHLPFVLVPGEGVVPRSQAIGLTELNGRAGFTTMADDDLERFTPLAEVDIPAGPYLLLDVDTGADTLDVVPDAALTRLAAAGRSPLTIDEGLALITHRSGILRSRNCFSTLASRCGDRRVPALWVSKGRPRLGWCWAAAPHAWLGSASCAGRAG
ncbi:MAG TPA: DUF5701 family protein [Jiangellaceae bacterium]|nr:DUF5701 family protein [Jiangellaceae bacterium]